MRTIPQFLSLCNPAIALLRKFDLIQVSGYSVREKAIEDKGEIVLTPWDIDTLPLDPGDALDFLVSLPGEEPYGVALSSSLRFWAEVANLSLELVTRQCFVPLLKVMVHHGVDRLLGKAFEREVKKHDLVISTYALAHRGEELFSKVHWECVALDEAQNIKNPVEKYRNPARAETHKRLIQPFVLRRMKTDPTIVNDLSEKMEINIFCNLSQEQATLYEAVVRKMLEKIEKTP